MSMRDFSDPRYKTWRSKVYKRDNFRCLECGVSRNLEAHHIIPWAASEVLRFEVSNGITLCKKHHDQMWGNESAYAARCHELINRKSVLGIKYELWKMRKEENRNG
jgi:5-methylcytosine-specific restriction endonuclease McrA